MFFTFYVHITREKDNHFKSILTLITEAPCSYVSWQILNAVHFIAFQDKKSYNDGDLCYYFSLNVHVVG